MTSASTLIRQAAKAKTKAEATRLRAQAAKLRREAREAKKPGPNPGVPDKSPPMFGGGLKGGIGDPNVNRAASALGNQAGVSGAASAMYESERAPLVPFYQAETLVKIATRKAKKNDPTGPLFPSPTELIHQDLCRIAEGARYDAELEAERRHIEALKRVHETNAISVVCAFVATANAMAKANRGPMPETVIVSGFQLARVVEALEKAGYSADGLKSMSRGALEARLNR